MRQCSLAAVLATWLPCAPCLAQQDMLQPTEAAMVLQLGLAPLQGGAETTGLAALVDVPGFTPMVHAIGQRCGEAWIEFQQLRRIINPSMPFLPLGAAEFAKIERVVLLGDPQLDESGLLIDFQPAHEKVAETLYERWSAQVRSAGVQTQEDTPWPGSRRLRREGHDDWVAVRGRQVATGRKLAGLKLGPAVAVEGGGSLRVALPAVAVPAVANPRTVALDLAIAEGIGFPGGCRTVWNLRWDVAGYRESLAWRGSRNGAVPARPLEAAPALPRLDGLFLALRANVDPAWLLVVLDAYAKVYQFEVAPVRTVLQQASGAVSLSVAAPPPGSFYPRVALALRVADPQACMTQLQRQAEATSDGALQSKEVDGAPLLMWTIAGAPPALRPSLGVIDGVLVVTECPATFRAARKAWGKGEDVFADAGAVPCAAPQGSTVLGEVWFDCQTIYERSAKVWGTNLTALALMPNLNDPSWQVAEVVDARDLPLSGDVAATLGRGRAVFYGSQGEIGVQVAAPTMGPVWSAVAAVGTVLVPQVLPMAIETRLREQRVLAAEMRARRLGAALVRYRAEHGGEVPDAALDLVPLLPAGDTDPLLAPHAPGASSQGTTTGSVGSFLRAPKDMTATPALAALPGMPPSPERPAPSRKGRPVFAFCTAGYRGYHMVILEDGEVVWIRSTALLDALTPK
ncbi:MAG: hypothetical protein KA020_14985 [Planctomycetes bacterium]|jgi:hypothetical protein|nr:hypothetical protein [Planctomycetota bacterium]